MVLFYIFRSCTYDSHESMIPMIIDSVQLNIKYMESVIH